MTALHATCTIKYVYTPQFYNSLTPLLLKNQSKVSDYSTLPHSTFFPSPPMQDATLCQSSLHVLMRLLKPRKPKKEKVCCLWGGGMYICCPVYRPLTC